MAAKAHKLVAPHSAKMQDPLWRAKYSGKQAACNHDQPKESKGRNLIETPWNRLKDLYIISIILSIAMHLCFCWLNWSRNPVAPAWMVLNASFPSQLDSLQQTAYIRGPYLSNHTSVLGIDATRR